MAPGLKRKNNPPPPPKRARGFYKGMKKPEGAGRKKGVTNITTRIVKDGLLEAAERIGFDGKGKDGLVGYLMRVAMRRPDNFDSMLARLIPLQVTGKDGGDLVIALRTKAEVAEKLRDRDLPVPMSLIDDTPILDNETGLPIKLNGGNT